jgi:chemotaxis signal transduction protein
MVQNMKELLLFQVGVLQLGMDLSFVRSIQSMPGIASKEVEKHDRFAPLAANHDISIYNLSAILGDENSSNNLENEKLIVVNTEDRPVGLIVERVHRVVKADIDMIEPLPQIFQGPALSCLPHVLKHEGRLVLLMSPKGMVNIVRQIQKHQVPSEELDLKIKDKRRLEVKPADTVIAEMIMKSRQNMMEWEGNQNPI